MSLRGIDVAWAQPTISQIKGTGATWVARYFSPDSTKNLTAAEVRDYAAAGLGTVTVWESSATRALDGYAAGQADAHTAEQQRAAVGLPPTQIIHFAVDTDTTWAAVSPYFAGAASVIGQARTGAYGGLKIVEGAYAAGYRFLWQTDAWSGGVWSAHATIRQEGGTVLAGQADYDTAEVVDFGQYPRPQETDMLTPAESQMLADIHAALPFLGWGFRNAQEEDAALKASGGKVHSLDAWGKISTTHDAVVAVQKGLGSVSAPQLTDAQVQALAAAVAPTLEQLLVPALLEAVGRALEAAQPPVAAAPKSAAQSNAAPAPAPVPAP